MPPKVALLIGLGLAAYAWRSDRKRDVGDPTDLFWPTLWYMVVSSRPLGIWFTLWNLPMPGGGDDATEGSPVDRYFFLILTIMGLRILLRRKFDWGAALRRNQWLAMLLLYMLISIAWSGYPLVSFKRYIKVVGSVVMAMVVLSHDQPLEAIFTVLRRCLYVHLPMSIICTRYFRDIGVTFEFDGGVEFWCGIATSKNTLGQVTVVAVLYFYFEVRRRWSILGWRNLHLLYLLMALFLLKGSDASISLTSVSVCVFSMLIFMRLQALRSRPEAMRPFVMTILVITACFVSFVLTHSVANFSADSIFGHVITAFGRDITLTGRTGIWTDVYGMVHNPLIGVGYGGFWIGRIANIPWNARMTWVLAQAHDGYIDVYLQLGIIGCLLLAGLIFNTMPRMIASAAEDYDFACWRITLFLTIIFIDITESVFLRGDHHLWLILMFVIWILPSNQPAATPPQPGKTSEAEPAPPPDSGYFTVPAGPGMSTRDPT